MLEKNSFTTRRGELKSGWVIWFTGLSGSGKSTVAKGLEKLFSADKLSVIVLDGDEFREKRFPSLGFSKKDIQKNNALMIEVCLEKQALHDIVLVPIISPYENSRYEARRKLSPKFLEIYCSVSISCVQRRDTKGLYAKETIGEINNLIGISKGSPYETPKAPDFILDTESQNPSKCVKDLYKFTQTKL